MIQSASLRYNLLTSGSPVRNAFRDLVFWVAETYKAVYTAEVLEVATEFCFSAVFPGSEAGPFLARDKSRHQEVSQDGFTGLKARPNSRLGERGATRKLTPARPLAGLVCARKNRLVGSLRPRSSRVTLPDLPDEDFFPKISSRIWVTASVVYICVLLLRAATDKGAAGSACVIPQHRAATDRERPGAAP
jgi:hypothetical protein